jgi:hypothetical protein
MSREYRTKPGTSRDPPSVKDKPMSDVPRPPSAFPPPVSDEAWELASAYLDDEVTPDERAQVVSSPMLLALVEQLRPAVNAVQKPVTIATASRELAISAALDVAGSPVEPAAAPANVRSLETARSAQATRRSNNRWLAPVAAAAAVVAIVGVGSAVFSRQSSKKLTSAESAATTAKASDSPLVDAATATTKAAEAATTAAPAALQSTNSPTTAAAVPATTPADELPTTAPATTTAAAATSAPKAATTAASPTAPVAPVGGGGPISQVEADELRRYLGSSYRQTFSPSCIAPADAPLAVGTIDWRGQQATVFVNDGRTVVMVIVDDGCVRAGGLTA